MLPNKNRQELEDRLIRISKILNDTYRNKSSEEYKMKGDITKSTYYPNIEKMIADLTTLHGYPKTDASDLNQMFNTLHRPFFKNMVREYMTEPNERNTVFCALFTLGYRLLIGELSRIYTSTEATPKGIEYRPDKVSRRNDISKIISIYKGDLEAKINAEIRATSKASTKIEESYLEDVIYAMYVEEYLDEAFGYDIYDESVKTMKRETRDALRSDVVRNAIGELVRSKDIPHVRLDDYDDDDDADGVKPVEEARFGRFREIRGDSPDMELPRLKNGASSGGPYPDSQRPRVVDGVEEPMLKSDTTMRTRPKFDDDDSPLAMRAAQARANRSPYPDSQRPREVGGLEEPMLKHVKEEEGETIGDTDEPISTAENGVDSTTECGDCNTKPVQEGVVDSMEKMAGHISDAADKIGPKISNIAAWAAPVAAGLGIVAKLFGRITSFFAGKNPIAELNFYFSNKYEKTIQKFNTVAANYFATKEAYDEYMKIPAAQRNKKVESTYVKNMDKYNVKMKNLEAQIEHFNSRAKDDASAPTPKPPKSAPKAPDTSGNDNDKPKDDDDDFEF